MEITSGLRSCVAEAPEMTEVPVVPAASLLALTTAQLSCLKLGPTSSSILICGATWND